MKRLCLWFLSSALVVPATLATTNYINYDTVTVVSPPQVAPQIDASNFVNYGIWYITNNYITTDLQPPQPYQAWNTRNWTNFNAMAGDSGFRFNYFDSVGQTNGPSANFYNGGNVNLTNANIFGSYYLLVAATNVYNRGTMAVGGTGLLNVSGEHLDLTRGTFGVLGNATNDLAGVVDRYWGTNDFGDGITGGTTVQNSMPVTTIVYPQFGAPYYGQMFASLLFENPCGTNIICPTGFTAYITTNRVFFHGAIHEAIDVLFLRQTNTSITTEVRFGGFHAPGAQKMIQWSSVTTNRVNGVLTTNRLFLSDTFGYWGIEPFLVQTPAPILSYTLVGAARYRPYNYSITREAPGGYVTMPVIPPTLVPAAAFDGTNFPTRSTNTAWAATLNAAAFTPDPTIIGSTWTNVPGRVELKASGAGSFLNLTRSIIDGPSYLLLSGTNHFVGSPGALISSPITDIYLGSTNGSLTVSNLLSPYSHQLVGDIQVMSSRWTNSTAVGMGTLYTVTMVDSALGHRPEARVQNLQLRSTNIVISDVLNVFNKLVLDAERITVTTNAGNAPTTRGEVNLTSVDNVWTPNLPRLQYLTNYGRISSLHSLYFASNSLPPWFTGIAEAPYQALVTHGHISSVGSVIWANYFEASGTNDTSTSPLTIRADTAIVTNGVFLATDADISITSSSLFVSNQVVQAGRALILTVTNVLDDGSLGDSVDMVTNKNVWVLGGGMNLPLLPSVGASLLGTTVTNNAFPNAPVDNVWAGNDYGNAPRGFNNNAALGRLVLDGQADSVFNFTQPDPTPTNAHALYVDLLELKGAAARADGQGNFEGVNLQTNFTIYYGDAVWNGMSIAEQLNGRFGEQGVNGGRFIWVSNYNTGFFSSTNITYTDGSGTVRLNRALALSCTLDSNSNGIPNCLDPNPVPVFTSSSVALKAMLQSKPSRSMVLSWNTVPGAQNYVYGSWTLPPSANWQLIDQFPSSATETRVTRTYDIPGSGTMYYRVRVVSP